MLVGDGPDSLNSSERAFIVGSSFAVVFRSDSCGLGYHRRDKLVPWSEGRNGTRRMMMDMHASKLPPAVP